VPPAGRDPRAHRRTARRVRLHATEHVTLRERIATTTHLNNNIRIARRTAPQARVASVVERRVTPRLFRSKPTATRVRVWLPGYTSATDLDEAATAAHEASNSEADVADTPRSGCAASSTAKGTADG